MKAIRPPETPPATRRPSPRAIAAGALLTGLAAALACCVAPRNPAPSPPPRTASPRPATPVTVAAPPRDWRDAAQTPGDWTWDLEAGRSTARFADGLLVLRCEAPGRITLSRTGNPQALTVTTTSTARTLSATPQTGTAVASLAADDPLLDAIAFSRGRFALTAAGVPPLYLPSWPEIARVIADCRQG